MGPERKCFKFHLRYHEHILTAGYPPMNFGFSQKLTLLDKRHFLHSGVLTGPEPTDVQTAGKAADIKAHFVLTRLLAFVYKRLDLSPCRIEHFQAHIHRFRQ